MTAASARANPTWSDPVGAAEERGELRERARRSTGAVTTASTSAARPPSASRGARGPRRARARAPVFCSGSRSASASRPSQSAISSRRARCAASSSGIGSAADPAQQRPQRAHVRRVERERGAQHAVDLLRAREDLLVDAREREERRQLRADLAARRDDGLERVDRLGPDALRDAQLRERQQRGHVLRRDRAHPAHGVDGDGAGRAARRAPRGRSPSRAGPSRPATSPPPIASRNALTSRSPWRSSSSTVARRPAAGDRVGLGLERALEHRRGPRAALGDREPRRASPSGPSRTSAPSTR